MAVFVTADSPSQLVAEVKKAIDEKKVETWEYDSDGDFTHIPEQWRECAWMRPHVEASRVVFGIIDRSDRNLSVVEYAVYHGRFVEMLLEHFDKVCKDINVSPMGTSYDVIKDK